MTVVIERGGLREPPFRFSDFATSVSSSSVEAFCPSDHPLLISPKGMRSSSGQARANVLCEDCERLFAKNGENYALRVAADRRGFKLLDELARKARRFSMVRDQ